MFRASLGTALRGSGTLLITLLVIHSAPQAAQAHSEKTRDVTISTKSADRAPARINLLAGPRPAKRKTVRASQVGNGSYICSPAGFGRKSRCYSN